VESNKFSPYSVVAREACYKQICPTDKGGRILHSLLEYLFHAIAVHRIYLLKQCVIDGFKLGKM
jgi:hypothetical protein